MTTTAATTIPGINQPLTAQTPAKGQFRFADACAGLGGFRLALAPLGGQCVWACDTNPLARYIYETNFAVTSPGGRVDGDVATADPTAIPNFDILTCGFPCQPYSSAGKRQGLLDSRAGVVTDLARILEAKQPAAFLFENVRGLLYRDQRRAFTAIRAIIASLGYSFHYKIIRACDHGLPQQRPRIFMVGFRDPATPFTWPARQPLPFTLGELLGGGCDYAIAKTLLTRASGKHPGQPNCWDTYLVDDHPHRLTIAEMKQLQGIPEDFYLPHAVTAARQLIGNAVAIPAARAVGREILRSLQSRELEGAR